MGIQEFDTLRNYLGIRRNIVVLAHTNPDGDALGSALAFTQYLEGKGHTVTVIVPNAFPGFLAWMPGASRIRVFEDEPAECVLLIQRSDLAFCMDFNALHRLDKMGEVVRKSSAVKILIDHHISPAAEFDLVFSETAVSSTSELVYQIIEGLGDSHLIDKSLATNLFVGIMTDTGSFSYACGHSQTFRIAADLIAGGVDPEWVHRQVFDTYSEDRMRLLGFSLSERMT
ncbi:MAG: DHH family phosphoesterase, partial [Bacteroidales bacterium]|nr:DHH family phosphoesterase [Bacteroidales bacterium]